MKNLLWISVLVWAGCSRDNPGYYPGAGTNGSSSTNGSSNGSGSGSTNGSTNGSTSGATNGAGGSDGTNGSATGTNGSTTGTNGGTMCTEATFDLARNLAPEVILVQDRSGSMLQDPDGSGGLDPTTPAPTSKWMQMKNALEQVVSSTGAVEWGLELFPQVGQDDFNNGCSVGTALDVAVGLGRAPSINSALDAAIPGGTTPTAAAISTAVQGFAASDGHPHYIVLATDGEPDCSVDAAMLDDPIVDSTNAVSAAVAAGVHVFVVGIGTDATDQMTLTNLANLGLQPNTTPGENRYYEVSTTSDLIGVLDGIASQITTCSFALPQAPSLPDLVTISVNGLLVPRDTGHLDGWDFGPGDLSIVLYGAACNDSGTLSAFYGCP